MNSKILIAFAALIMLIAGCSDDYYSDGGVLDENIGVLNISTMDYLEANEASFDTLVALIQLTGLESAVDATGNTFMAVQDYSIANYFDLAFSVLDEEPESLEDIPQEILDDIKVIIENYIVPNEEIMRDDLSTAYSYSSTFGGRTARFNLLRSDYLDNLNQGAEIINYSVDMSNDESSDEYHSVSVVTSNLESTNGIIHILNADSHIFGFN